MVLLLESECDNVSKAVDPGLFRQQRQRLGLGGGRMLLLWLALSPLSLNPRVGLVPLCVVCMFRVCVGSLRVFQLPPTVQRHTVSHIGDSKLPVGVWLFVYVALQWTCPG